MSESWQIPNDRPASIKCECGEYIDLVPVPLTWTIERPTATDMYRHYWARHKDGGAEVYFLSYGPGNRLSLEQSSEGWPLDEFTHFAGPIAEPCDP